MNVKTFIHGIERTLLAKELKATVKDGKCTWRLYRPAWLNGYALHCIDRDRPSVQRTAENIGRQDAALWLLANGCRDIPEELWPMLRGRVQFEDDGRPIIPAPSRGARKRRRQSATPTAPLTPAQTEALQMVGEHKGNVAAAAKATGKSRTAMEKLYKKGLAKLGKRDAEKVKTRALPTDARGQQDVRDPKSKKNFLDDDN